MGPTPLARGTRSRNLSDNGSDTFSVVDLRGPDLAAVHLLDLGRDLLDLRQRPAREHDVREHLLLHRRLVRDDTADAAGSDDEDLRHGGYIP